MSIRAAVRPLLRAAVRAPIAARVVPAVALRARAFTATARALGSGEKDGELAAALQSEHAYENESAGESHPAFIKEFEADGRWKVQDKPGCDDVTLTSKFGDESLKLTFQVSDLDAVEAGEEEADGEDLPEPSFITSSLLITKGKSSKALMIDLGATPEGFEVTNVAIYDKTMAEAEGAEGDWNRRSQYMGPQFDTLDQNVQDTFQQYLEERYVDEALSNFIISYTEFKEQNDYVTWLDDMKKFVEA